MQTVANSVRCGIEEMHADPRYQAVLQRVMAKREVFLQIGISHSSSIPSIDLSEKAAQFPADAAPPPTY
jgi:hypothetical protein